MSRRKTIHIEENAVRHRAAYRGQSLIQTHNGIGQAVRKICIPHVTKGCVVRSDETLQQNARGTVGAKASQQLCNSSGTFFDFRFNSGA
jgi:hypothetical protein